VLEQLIHVGDFSSPSPRPYGERVGVRAATNAGASGRPSP
jgi:hypothetical protein